MKPLDLKLEWLRRHGLGVEQRGDAVYVYAMDTHLRWRVLILFGNPSYRTFREKLSARFRWHFI